MVVTITPINPKRLSYKAILREVTEEAKREAKEQKEMMDQTVKGWRHRVTFKDLVQVGPDAVIVAVKVEGTAKAKQVWEWVDRGTRPHIIRPVRAKRLRFRQGYRRSTNPGSFKSKRNSRFGATVYAQMVRHPGFPGRGWSDHMAETRPGRFRSRIIRAIERGANKMF